MHHCLQEFGILPSQFLDMDAREKAFVIASIDIRSENEKKQEKKMKAKSGGGKRGGRRRRR